MENTPVQPQVDTFGQQSQGGASGRAIAALVLGIVSLVACGCFAGIAALILAYGELKAIDAGQSSPAGRGYAKAGLIMGWISIGLSILGAIIWFFVAGAALLGMG